MVLSLVDQELWAVGHPDHGDGDEKGGHGRNDGEDAPRTEAVCEPGLQFNRNIFGLSFGLRFHFDSVT